MPNVKDKKSQENPDFPRILLALKIRIIELGIIGLYFMIENLIKR